MDPEKKKTIVVGALFVAMLGIGAFQFSKIGGEEVAPPPAAKTEETTPEAEEKSEGKGASTKNPMYALGLPARDPFRPAAFSVSIPEEAAPVLPAPTAKPVPSPKPIDGDLPPMPTGDVPGFSGGLPDPSGTPNVQAPPPKPRFQGALIGVLVGVRSAAVFRFGESERIVTIGSEIEPGVRLLSVSPRKAVIRFHGETITLNLRDEAPVSSPTPSSPSPSSAAAPKSATTAPTGSTTPSIPQIPNETPNE